MKSESKKYKIAQDSKYVDDDWWNWSIWVEGNEKDLDEITCVVYTLHSTFKNPVRKVEDRESKFKLESDGWGVFTIYARIFLKDDKEISLEHELSLSYPDGTANME